MTITNKLLEQLTAAANEHLKKVEGNRSYLVLRNNKNGYSLFQVDFGTNHTNMVVMHRTPKEIYSYLTGINKALDMVRSAKPVAQPAAAPQEPEEEGRKCSTCGNPMNEGYCIDGGTEYYCSEPCLHAKYSPEQWADMYDDGKTETYWTTWEE